MPGDFDRLFDDDWKPQDAESDGPASLRGRGDEAGMPAPFEPNAFESLFADDADFTSESENRAPRVLNEKEVKVMGVYMHQQDREAPPQHFVLMRDNKGRRIRIWVGLFEAWAISLALEGDTPERPMTHDLIKLVLDRLEATIERVVIDDLWNETFYAKVTLVKPAGDTLDIDCRPSDAIALAVRTRAPIYMAEVVLEATLRPD